MPELPSSTTQDFSWMLGLMPYSEAGAKAPANRFPNQARVNWDSRGLEIKASNSSLNQILHQVAADTGAKLEGLTQDQRVFGSYGPGPGSDVLWKLLDGSGYNVLMLGGHDPDSPLKIVLSARSPPARRRPRTIRTAVTRRMTKPASSSHPSRSPTILPRRAVSSQFKIPSAMASCRATRYSSCRRSCSVSSRSTSSNNSRGISSIIRSSNGQERVPFRKV